MATTLSKIKSQIEKLQKQAESIQSGVIARIKREIAQHGLTAQDLFGASGGASTVGDGRAARANKGPKKASGGKAAKFADGQGNTWHGVGKRPQWIHDVLAAGRELEEYLVGKFASPAETSKSKESVKGRAKPAKAKTARAAKTDLPVTGSDKSSAKKAGQAKRAGSSKTTATAKKTAPAQKVVAKTAKTVKTATAPKAAAKKVAKSAGGKPASKPAKKAPVKKAVVKKAVVKKAAKPAASVAAPAADAPTVQA